MTTVRSRLCLLLALLVSAPAHADTARQDSEHARPDPTPLHLWTVQAVQTGDHTACDAFAQGAAGRPPYEIRFRREPTRLLLIVAYDGPQIPATQSATVLLDGQAVGTFRVVMGKFGARNDAVISLAPASVDFTDVERHRSMTIVIGSDQFLMGFLAADRLAIPMNSCMEKMFPR